MPRLSPKQVSMMPMPTLQSATERALDDYLRIDPDEKEAAAEACNWYDLLAEELNKRLRHDPYVVPHHATDDARSYSMESLKMAIKYTVREQTKSVKTKTVQKCVENDQNQKNIKSVKLTKKFKNKRARRGQNKMKRGKRAQNKIKRGQRVQIKRGKRAQNKIKRGQRVQIKRGERAQNIEKSDREAQSKFQISSLSSGRGDVPVAYEDDKASPEQNSNSMNNKHLPAAGIMHASVQNTKPEAPTGHCNIIYKILSIIFKVIPKNPIYTIQIPLIEIICTMLCPSDRHQYRLWAQKGHLLYFIFKIAPYIIACGQRSCLWPYNYPLDLMPGALESLAYIMATIILSVHCAFDTELISPLDALKTTIKSFGPIKVILSLQ